MANTVAYGRAQPHKLAGKEPHDYVMVTIEFGPNDALVNGAMPHGKTTVGFAIATERAQALIDLLNQSTGDAAFMIEITTPIT